MQPRIVIRPPSSAARAASPGGAVDPEELKAFVTSVRQKSFSPTNSTTTLPGNNNDDSVDDGGFAKAIGFKKVSKLMPKTAQKLREGSLDPEEFARTVHHQLDPDVHNIILKVGDFFAQKAVDAIPPDTPRRLEHRALSAALAFAFNHERSLALNDPRGNRDPLVDAKCMKRAFDSTCQRLLKQLGGKSFRKRCKLFNAPAAEYQKALQEFYADGRVNNVAKQTEQLGQLLHCAAKGIVDGLDLAKKACWQCETVLTCPKTCAKCGCALYCGRECQLSHWDNGQHKKHCKTLAAVFAVHEESLQALDKAHETGILEETFLLCPSLDYSILSSATFRNMVCGRKEGIGFAGARGYFGNLERIVRGEFWFYPDAPEMSEYQQELERLGKTKQDERAFLGTMIEQLAYDYTTFTAPFPEGTPVLTTTLPTVARSFGVKMPAQRFMELYSEQAEQEKSVGAKRVRQRYSAIALKHLQELQHWGSEKKN